MEWSVSWKGMHDTDTPFVFSSVQLPFKYFLGSLSVAMCGQSVIAV